jgi:hypothetical protein
MPGEDSLSSRFDYLFEPLEVEEPVDDAGSHGTSAGDGIPGPSTASVRTAFAAFVLGTLGVAAVIAVLLLQKPAEPPEPVGVPLAPAPLSTMIADMPSLAAPVLPPTTADVPIEAPPNIDSMPAQLSAQ